MSTSCALCGAFLGGGNSWRAEFRAIYIRSGQWNQVQLSGVGLCGEQHPLGGPHTAPVEPELHYRDPNLGPNNTIDIVLNSLVLINFCESPQNATRNYWGFGFHASCWDVLTAKFKPRIEDLFNACLSTSIGVGGVFYYGHDYGGTAHFRKGHHAYNFFVIIKDHWRRALYCFNPMEILNIHDVSGSAPCPDSEAGVVCKIPTNEAENVARDDTFTTLPIEILDAILIELPSKDACSLRFASRAFANIGFSEAFWASRFSEGYEYSFLFEARRGRPKSWKGLYFTVKGMIQTSPNLVNRRRVWDLATYFHDVLIQMQSVSCLGRPLYHYCEPGGDRDDRIWLTASRGLAGLEDRFTKNYGCRSLRSRTTGIRPFLRVSDIFVSFIRLCSGVFVSGLRFRQEDGEDICLGYVRAGREINVDFPVSSPRKSSFVVHGFHLALHHAGVKAIAVLTDDGSLSSWVGDYKDIPKWCLVDDRGTPLTIRAEFDALKLVSLSISTDTMKHGWPAETEEFSLRNICLWDPDIPEKHFLFDGAVKDYLHAGYKQYGSPISTVIFGGAHGQDLSKLVAIAVWIYDVSHITGIEFIYTDDSDNRIFGDLGPFTEDTFRTFRPSNGQRVTFSIDGPGGERIESVGCQRGGNLHLGEQQEFVRFGLKIRTSYGRVALFPPALDIEDEKWSMIMPSGDVIVGFCWVFTYEPDCFSLISIKMGPQAGTAKGLADVGMRDEMEV